MILIQDFDMFNPL